MNNTTLRIGFDAKRVVSNATGLGSYGRTLVSDLARTAPDMQLHLYAPHSGRADLRGQVEGSPNVSLHYAPPSHLPLARQWWRSRGIVSQLKADGISVFHGLSGELPMGLRQAGIPSVVTIHDLIFMRHPEFYNPIDVRIYTWKFRLALREASRIVAISECTRRDVAQLGGIAPERIEVVYQSCAQRFMPGTTDDERRRVARSYALPSRYVLSVGSIEQRKNLLLAVKALQWLPADVHLVAVGKPTQYADKLLAEARRSGLEERVHLLHGVPDADLPAIYEQAESFVYPSRYEGFGIPIIEAIRMGLPVVGCTGSCLEEAGGPDSLYVGPDDAEALAGALRCTLRGAEGREERIRRSRDYVQCFANSTAAQRFASLYASLVGTKA